MTTDSSFFFLLILVGSVFTVAGVITLFFPPKKINYLYGYRTKRSMKSLEHWKFAQKYATVIMIKLGIFMMLLSFAGLLYSFSEKIDFYIAMGVFILIIIYLVIKTENAIKTNFPEN